jgi:hypothetical protein
MQTSLTMYDKKNIKTYRGIQGFKKGYQQRTWLPMIRVLDLMIPKIFWNCPGITCQVTECQRSSWHNTQWINIVEPPQPESVSKYKFATEMVKTGHKPLNKFLQKWSDVEIKLYVLRSMNWLILQIQQGLCYLRHKKYWTQFESPLILSQTIKQGDPDGYSYHWQYKCLVPALLLQCHISK